MNLIPVSIFALVAFLLVVRFLDPNIILGGGENSLFLDKYYTEETDLAWSNAQDFGKVATSQNSDFLFFKIFLPVLNVLSSVIHSSVLFLAFSVFLSSVFCYLFLRSCFNCNESLLFVPASLLLPINAFRLLAPLSIYLSFFFILLPLFLWLVTLFFRKYSLSLLFLMSALTFLSSSLGGNLSLFVVLYFFVGLYYLYSTITLSSVALRWKYALSFIFLSFSALLTNAFWMFTLLKALFSIYSFTDNAQSVFTALGAGKFYDHFRFLGSWGWKAAHLYEFYYPFHIFYYKFPLLLITLFFALVSLYPFIYKGKTHAKKVNFFILVYIIFFTLLAGGKGPFGFIYNFLYRNLLPFKLFREPFTKFMPIFVLFSCFGISLFLLKAKKYFASSIYTYALSFLFTFLVIISAFPLFGSAIPEKRWNGGSWSAVVEIPEYWKEFASFVSSNMADSASILVFGYTPYGTSNNWEHGVTVVGNIAQYLLKNRVIAPTVVSNSLNGSAFMLKDLISLSKRPGFEKLLGFLGIDYVLLENDLEWRYSDKILSPDKNMNLLNNLDLSGVGMWGKFSPIYLSGLLNGEKDGKKWLEFYTELDDKPALSLFKVPEKYKVPLIYATEECWLVGGDISSLVDLVSIDSPGSTPIYYFIPKEDNSQYFPDYSRVISVWDSKDATVSSSLFLDSKLLDYPEASVNPSALQYSLVRSKESFLLWKHRKDFLSKVEILSWLGLKRLVEVENYDLTEELQVTLLGDSIKKLDKAVAYLKENSSIYPTENLIRAFQFCGNALIKATNHTRQNFVSIDYERELDNLLTSYFSLYKEMLLASTDAYLTVPVSGDYFAVSSDFTKSNFISNPPISINVESPSSSCDMSVGLEESSCLLNSEERYVVEYSGITSQEFLPVPFLSKSISVENINGFYAQFSDLDRYSKYNLTFGFNSHLGSNLRVSILEYPKYQDDHAKIETLFDETTHDYTFIDNLSKKNQEYFCSGFNDNLCFVTFKHTFSPTYDDSNIYVYLTPSPQSIDVILQEPLVQNLSVTPFKNTQFFFIKDLNVLSNGRTKLSYQSLSPAEYILDVFVEEFPTNIVFNSSFNSDWELYYDRGGSLKEILGPLKSNGFSNFWEVAESDVDGKHVFKLHLVYKPQFIFETLLSVALMYVIITLLGSLVFAFLRIFSK